MAEKGLKYGLKLWSTNVELVPLALEAYKSGAFDFIEIYSNPETFRLEELQPLSIVPITIHATHTHGFHEFMIGDEQKRVWQQTLQLADFFESDVIVVHPGREQTIASFMENLALIDDSRIRIENMAGLDIDGNIMFGQRLDDLKLIAPIKPICFDLEKAVKAACHQGMEYKNYIEEAIDVLHPDYFHISGGYSASPIDQHLDLSEADFDIRWMKKRLENLESVVRLVFETPKKDGIINDLENMAYFRSL